MVSKLLGKERNPKSPKYPFFVVLDKEDDGPNMAVSFGDIRGATGGDIGVLFVLSVL